MRIDTAAYFYVNYVGETPEDDLLVRQTEAMIRHYVNSGVDNYLPQIYTYCAKDRVVNTTNIPYQLWKEGNLLKPGTFYLHPELKLMNRMPEISAIDGSIVEFEYYCEMKERYTLRDIILYARKQIKRKDYGFRDDEDEGSIKYLLKRYKDVQASGLNPLDMVLFLIDEAKGKQMRLIELSTNENEAYQKLMAYDQKLTRMNRHHIHWRGALSHA